VAQSEQKDDRGVTATYEGINTASNGMQTETITTVKRMSKDGEVI